MKVRLSVLIAVVSASLIAVALTACSSLSVKTAQPKKLLVVTTTTEFRHTSIPNLEKMIAQLGKSSGEFTVDFIHQPTNTSRAELNAAMKTALLRLSPTNLVNYDGVVFASTTGQLPIPDPQGLLDWIKAGHAFIGIHAASDTFHRWPAYIEMLGGEFDHHGAQLSVDCLNQDPQHPATASLPKVWTIKQEEMYQFKNYDPAKVHDLLILDKSPDPQKRAGHFPVTWCKPYSEGRVFYTSLGHREDIIDDDPNLPGRRNPIEITKQYRAQVLGGIEWALKLKNSAPAPVPSPAPVP